MRRLSVKRLREAFALKAQRGLLDDENEDLAERSETLWQAVLALDGSELSNPRILKEQMAIRRGLDRIKRTIKRLTERRPIVPSLVRNKKDSAAETLRKAVARAELRGDAEDEEAVNTLEELRRQLKDRDYVLGNEQREYQMARAKALIENLAAKGKPRKV